MEESLNPKHLDWELKKSKGPVIIEFLFNEKNLNKETYEDILKFFQILKRKNINFILAKEPPRCIVDKMQNEKIKVLEKPLSKNILNKCKNCIMQMRKQCSGV